MESSTDKNSLLRQASRNRTLSLDSPCPVREGEGSRASISGWYILTEEIPDNRSLRNGIDEVVKSYDRAHQIHHHILLRIAFGSYRRAVLLFYPMYGGIVS